MKQAVGGSPPSPAIRVECGCTVPISAWYHLAHELSQPSSVSQIEVFQELGCCEGMLLITSGMQHQECA